MHMATPLLNLPDDMTVFLPWEAPVTFTTPETQDGICLSWQPAAHGYALSLTTERPLNYLRLRWHHPFAPETRFCGDAWERTYGDSQWRTADPARIMPWYFLAATPEETQAFGVQVRPHAMAAWTCDSQGVTLWFDLRSGTRPLRLQGRKLQVATILSAAFTRQSPFQAARDFCALMCPDPLLPQSPVYGSNNWYYAYSNITHDSVLKDAQYLAELTPGLENRPYMVIDDGWQGDRRPDYNGGPWLKGNEKFPDMKRLAEEMSRQNVRPGLWYRPLYLQQGKCSESISEQWRMRHNPNVLDPSVPQVLDWIRQDLRRFHHWGFQLVKHDFTTYDTCGHYGFDMRFFPPASGVEFHDDTRTTAEIILGLYQTIREAAEDMTILGCNTIGHLGAGLMHLSRTGDDTSGRKWERTRKMGINTLAFRLCQNGTFFSGDADCIGITGAIPWYLNRQWSELVAKSGTAYFCSILPGILTPEEKTVISNHLAIASQQQETVTPLDWFNTTVPEHWESNGQHLDYDWFPPEGDLPDFI